MAYISFQPKDYFNTKLYTGNDTTNSITGVGFQPDFTWIKEIGTNNHWLFDSARGVQKYLYSNTDAADATNSNSLTAWGADGFTLGSEGAVNASGVNFASWNWKMGTTSGIATNGSTTITPSAYSFNTTSKFSIIKYTGNSTAGAKLAHGLGAVPKTVIVKSLHAGDAWAVYHVGAGNTHYGTLNTNAAFVDDATRWYDTDPDSVNFTLGSSGAVNSSSKTYIAWCFAGVRGASKFGSFTGNGNVDGSFIYTGFRPNMIIIKNTSGQNWNLFDTVRNPSNVANKTFTPDTNAAEAVNGTGAGDKKIDILSNGFKIRTNSNELNQSSVNHIYMAWAEQPIVGSNGIAGVAR